MRVIGQNKVVIEDPLSPGSDINIFIRTMTTDEQLAFSKKHSSKGEGEAITDLYHSIGLECITGYPIGEFGVPCSDGSPEVQVIDSITSSSNYDPEWRAKIFESGDNEDIVRTVGCFIVQKLTLLESKKKEPLKETS